MANIKINYEAIEAALATFKSALESYNTAKNTFSNYSGCLDEMNSDFINEMKEMVNSITKDDADELVKTMEEYATKVKNIATAFNEKDTGLARDLYGNGSGTRGSDMMGGASYGSSTYGANRPGGNTMGDW